MSRLAWREPARIARDPELPALADAAAAVREHAWAPYSGFRVGAALVGASGRVYLGCNVENASYSAGICAERTAVVTAVAAGERAFTRIVILTDAVEPAAPCGICRQMLAEFCLATADSDLPVTLLSTHGGLTDLKLSALLPMAFTPGSFRVKPMQ